MKNPATSASATATIGPRIGSAGYELYIEGCNSTLNVTSFTGKEALSKLYSFEVRFTCGDNLLHNPDPNGTASPWLRARALLKLPVGNAPRFVRGIVASIVPEGETTTVHRPASVVPLAPVQFWKARIVPTLWLAKKQVHSRIFQNKSTPEIVAEILGSQDYALLGMVLAQNLHHDYPKRLYCMQYQESDYAFIKRILSEEGIFWYFDHGREEFTADSGGAMQRFLYEDHGVPWHDDDNFAPTSNAERLVLLDTADYPPLDVDPADRNPAPDTLQLSTVTGGALPSRPTSLWSFELEHTVKPNAVLLRDYDYRRPRLDITASAPTAPRPGVDYVNDGDAVEKWWTWESRSQGRETRGADTDHTRQTHGGATVYGLGETALGDQADEQATQQLRVYEHHCPLGPDRVDEEHAEERLDQYQRNRVRANGTGCCRHLAPGYYFTFHSLVPGVTNLDRDYVVTKIEHVGDEHGAADEVYRNRFVCVPKEVAYRPKRKPKRRREVIETATVVGPVGHEVYTDKLGRVEVKFHWDLHGGTNEKDCCWVRVLQGWSGTAYGAQFLPRVGTEVLVSFREGDHDRPVVIGSVYNGVQPFPFMPPEGQNRSGFRTRSTPGGNGYNELSFEDTAGKERVILRAQTDYETFVGRDRKTIVRGSEVKGVTGKQTERVKADLDRAVGGDAKVHVEGLRLDQVDGRSETKVGEDCFVEVGGAERHHIQRTGWLGAGDDLTTETEGNHATVVGKHDAKRSFALHVEGASHLKSTGITELVSPQGLRLRCGSSIIEVMEDQILLVSDKIMLQAPGVQMELREAGELWVDADDKAVIKSKVVTLKGEQAMLKLTDKAELLGPQISLSRPESVEGLDETERELTTIELKDENGDPLPRQRYILVFEDGSEQSGFLDENGQVELVLDEGASIRFPGLVDVAAG